MNGTGTRPVPVWSGSGWHPNAAPLSGAGAGKIRQQIDRVKSRFEKILAIPHDEQVVAARHRPRLLHHLLICCSATQGSMSYSLDARHAFGVCESPSHRKPREGSAVLIDRAKRYWPRLVRSVHTHAPEKCTSRPNLLDGLAWLPTTPQLSFIAVTSERHQLSVYPVGMGRHGL